MFTIWTSPEKVAPIKPADGFCEDGNVCQTTDCGQIIVFTLRGVARMYWRNSMGNRHSIFDYDEA